jgi:hypothetical protein
LNSVTRASSGAKNYENIITIHSNICQKLTNGSALDSDIVLFNSICAVDGDLIVGFITVLDTQVKRLQLDVEERQDEFVFDRVPNDASHLIT